MVRDQVEVEHHGVGSVQHGRLGIPAEHVGRAVRGARPTDHSPGHTGMLKPYMNHQLNRRGFLLIKLEIMFDV